MARVTITTYHRLCHTELLSEALASHVLVEEMANECSDGARIGRWSEREKEEWQVESYRYGLA